MSSSRPPARTRTHLRPLFLLLFLFSFFSSFTLAAPHQPWYEKYNQPRVTVPQSYYEASALRRRVGVRAGAVREVKCLDTKARILLHDEHAATLATCPSFSSSSSSGRSSDNRRCEGEGGVAVGAETVGRVGSAVFELETVERRRRRMALQIQNQTQTATQGQEQKAVSSSSSSYSGVSSSPSSSASAGADAASAATAGAGEEEATINVTKEAWAACVAAARAVCSMGSFEAVCVGAATRRGDVWFQLRRA